MSAAIARTASSGAPAPCVTISCGILFLRIAYVSLPRGIAPFDRVTDVFFAIPSLW